MKKLSFIIMIMIAFQSIVSAQKVIINPAFSSSSTTSFSVDRIELNDTSTTLWFKATYAPKSWITIDSNSYIQLWGSGEKLSIKATKNMDVAFNKRWTMPDSGIRHYALIYPPLPANEKKFDFIENEESNWKIYGITLHPKESNLPESLKGNWLENNKTNKWVVGLYDSLAIYDNKIWHYGKIVKVKSDFKISLTANNTSTTIYLHGDTLGHCFIGTNPLKEIECSHYQRPINEHKSTLTDNSFPSPFYKYGFAIIKGFINAYCAKSVIKDPYPFKSVYSGGPYMNLKANDDGTFEVKIPIIHAGRYSFLLPRINKNSFFQASVYLEEGRETFCYFDLSDTYEKDSTQKKKPKYLFMGDNAEVNAELTLVDNFPKNQKNKTSLFDSTDNYGFKKYQEDVLGYKTIADATVFSLLESNAISEKTAAILKAENKVAYSSALLITNSLRENKYKDDHHIKSKDYSKKFLTPITLGFPYLNPVKDVLKDTSCQLSKSFGSILSIMNSLDEIKKPDFSYTGILDKLTAKGIVFTKEEKLLYNKMSGMTKPGFSFGDSTEFYKKIIGELGKKYKDTIAIIYKDIKLSSLTSASIKYFDAPSYISDYISIEMLLLQMGMQNKTMDSAELTTVLKDISVPAFAEFLSDFNKNSIVPIIPNKGSVVRELPVSNDSVYDAIISKYKGKVVYLDFWETWCMPCKMSLETIAPLKEELKDSNIVFVCISSESSPLETWKSLNKGIRAEHYRLTSEQYAALNRMFTIETIPRCVLINKTGKVVNKDVGHKSNDEIKKLLLNQLRQKD